MSIASIEQASFAPSPSSRAIVRRFVWKEYRVLRGLWLAVAVMALLVDWAIGVLTPPQYDFAMLYFSTALAAAVLYAVGAAATTFSVEHEEETYNFLSGLPSPWWPMFAGKLAVSAVSAAALAGVLAVVGWIICGFDTPGGRDTPAALGLFGVAIVEALAWGTLFSLLMKRPLIAAVLTLVVGATATHLAANFSPSHTAVSLNPSSYLEAIPMRLAIVAIVLACSGVVARRWLVTGLRPATNAAHRPRFISGLAAQILKRIRWWKLGAAPGGRRRMMARLVWQTWRESWKRLPLPIVVAFALLVATSLVGQLIQDNSIELAVAATTFFAPTLFGALAFSADQRRGSYRFLAEHAARPRYVWLARHVLWLGALVVLWAIVAAGISGLIAVGIRTNSAAAVEAYLRWDQWAHPSAQQMALELQRGISAGIQVAGLAWWGMLTAYGIGQFCSMLMRSEIMAAFVALMLSILLAGWVAVLFVWQLPSWIFLLPLFAGFMLATWLRSPAWIADQRTWRGWIPPALAIAASLVLVGGLLPAVRLAQLPGHMREVNGQPIDADAAIVNQLDWYRQGNSPAARETAAMYLRAADLMHSWETSELLQQWSNAEYTEAIGDGLGLDAMGGGAMAEEHFGIDISKIPADEQAAFREAARKLSELAREATEAARKLAIEASQRPTCRFSFDVAQAQLYPRDNWHRQLDLDSIPGYSRLNELLKVVQSTVDSEKRLLHLLSALRMSAHLRSGQPTAIFIDQLHREQEILAQISQWASDEDRTEKQLNEAVGELNEHFVTAYVSPDENLVADYVLIQNVLEGDAFPLALTEGPNAKQAYLAYLANQLGWERTRGVRALGVITLQNIFDANKLMQSLADQTVRDYGSLRVRHWQKPIWDDDDWAQRWMIEQSAAATSYLTRYEYVAQVRIYDLHRAIYEAEVHRRAALAQLALAKFRRDHDAYPKSLAELVPDYIDHEPLDPYSGQPFQFAPAGLELPVQRVGYSVANAADIPPGTPFLWSVGAGNTGLERRVVTRYDGLENVPEEERREVKETVYALEVDPTSWYYPALFFPLPK